MEEWAIFQILPKAEGVWSDPDGFVYFNISLSEEPVGIAKETEPVFQGCPFHSYGIMLPNHWKGKERQEDFFMYAFLCENWESLKALGRLATHF